MVIVLQQTSDNNGRFISTVVEEEFLPGGGGGDSSGVAEEASANNIGGGGEIQLLHHSSNINNPNDSSGSTTRSSVSNCSSTRSSSSFSLSSQHTLISERSAIYKQRIDSLFGRRTKFTPFKPGHFLQPFSIKIEDSNCSSSNNCNNHKNSKAKSSGESETKFSISKNNNADETRRKIINHKLYASTSDDDDDDDDDEENAYQKILEHNKNLSSILTDSLNTFSQLGAAGAEANFIRKKIGFFEQQQPAPPIHRKTANNFRNPQNVTSVQITREEEVEENSQDLLGGFFQVQQRIRMPGICQSNKMGDNISEGQEAEMPFSGKNNCEGHQLSSSSSSNVEKSRFSAHQHYPQENRASGSSPSNFHGCDLRFAVEYLGSTPVQGNTTALEDLQAPLCLLYTNYLTGKNILNGELAITKDGLRFEAPKLRLVNPFTTIAVWAAIKFVAKGGTVAYPNEFAFMPLISDPEGQDKGRLFGPMSEELARIYRAKCFQGGGLNKPPFRNPPIFACVMREASFALDCHAFVCHCAEDAIVVAANLYQSLVDKMRHGCSAGGRAVIHKEGESGYGTLTRTSPANNNTHSPSSCSSSCSPPLPPPTGTHAGLSPFGNDACCSGRAGYQQGESNAQPSKHEHPHKHRVVFSDSESLLIPVRPPRRNHANKSKKPGAERPTAWKSNLKHYNSDDSVLLKLPQRRISINRGKGGVSGAGGGYRPHYVKNTKRVKISTPEEELSSSSEVLMSESIDKVLDRIINPGGMSFNDLKPSYQQLLLKIALTLTQDQLYQKSKEAMKKYQFPIRGVAKSQDGGRRKGKGRLPSHNGGGIETEEQSQFLGAFLKSFSKITSGKIMSSGNFSSSSASSPSCPVPSSEPKKSMAASRLGGDTPHAARQLKSPKATQPSKLPRKIILKKNSPANGLSAQAKKSCREEEPFMSFCSGCACNDCSDKCYCSLPSKQNVKLTELPISSQLKSHEQNLAETKEGGNIGSRDSRPETESPVPCSSKMANTSITTKPCGYDTEKCNDTEKCYCSLQRVKSNGIKIYNINLDTETSDTDTNSYDLEPFNHHEPTTTMSSSSNLKTVSTKSVEILSYHPARRLSYCSSNAGNQSPGSVSSQQNPSTNSNNVTALQRTNATVHQNESDKFGDGLNAGRISHININQKCHQDLQSPSFHSSPSPKGILCNNMDSNNPQQQQPHCSKVLLMTGLTSSSPAVLYNHQQQQHSSSNFKRQNESNPTTANMMSRATKVRIEAYRSMIGIDEDEFNEEEDVQCDGGDMNKQKEASPSSSGSHQGPEADKVLSMKKTAEIEAMFKDLRLVQANLANNNNLNGSVLARQPHHSNFDGNENPRSDSGGDSIDFETSLGYLP